MLKYFTKDSKALLEAAMCFAESRRSTVICTEDLISALSADESTTEFYILCSLGLVQPSHQTGISPGLKVTPRENLEFSQEVKAAIKLALEMHHRKDSKIRPSDIVFGLVKQWLLEEGCWSKTAEQVSREDVIIRLLSSYVTNAGASHEVVIVQPLEKMRHLVAQMNRLNASMSLQLAELERTES